MRESESESEKEMWMWIVKIKGGRRREIVCVFREIIYRMRWEFYIAMLKHIIYLNTMGPSKINQVLARKKRLALFEAGTKASPSPFFVSLVRDIIYRNVFWRTKSDQNL